MNLVDASLRAIPIGAVAMSIPAIARWRGKPLAASFEHALWTCVLAAMLAFAVPKVTVHAGLPAASPTVHRPAPPPILTVRPNDPPTVFVAASPHPSTIAIIWIIGSGLMFLRISAGVLLTRHSLAGGNSVLGDSTIRSAILDHASLLGGVEESDHATVPMTVGWP
jgi:hypothetical protein